MHQITRLAILSIFFKQYCLNIRTRPVLEQQNIRNKYLLNSGHVTLPYHFCLDRFKLVANRLSRVVRYPEESGASDALGTGDQAEKILQDAECLDGPEKLHISSVSPGESGVSESIGLSTWLTRADATSREKSECQTSNFLPSSAWIYFYSKTN